MAHKSAYVAFLDILGFSDLIKHNEIQKLIIIYKSVLEELCSYLPKLSTWEKPRPRTVNLSIVQDSMILWIEADEFYDLYLMLGTVQMILQNSFLEGLPIRGAISRGEISILTGDHENYSIRTILGKPLVEAYQMEKNQNWMGCVCDKSIFNDRKKPEIEYLKANYLIQYKIPLKEGPINSEYAVIWHSNKIKQNAEKMVRDAFSKHNKRINNWDIENKIINTIKFINEVNPIVGAPKGIHIRALFASNADSKQIQ